MLSYHGLMRLLFGKRITQSRREEVVEEMVEIFLRGVCSR